MGLPRRRGGGEYDNERESRPPVLLSSLTRMYATSPFKYNIQIKVNKTRKKY